MKRFLTMPGWPPGMRLIESLAGVEAIIVDSNGAVSASTGMSGAGGR